MDILAISYKNIWPFYDKTLSINFKKWKYLIKAPIWIWKSFLFFDGPMFALYKNTSRTVLNRKSKDWFIKIIFEANNDYYFLTREIKVTKAGQESVNSRLFKIDDEKDLLNQISINLQDIVNKNIDIEIFINNIQKEEISFKSQQELQKNLEQIIWLREIIQSTSLLMQDSDNIFEILPSERINIFKNIFGLVWIDDAKDIISEKRKEVQLNIKIKADSSNYDIEIKKNISEIKKNLATINQLSQKNLDETIKNSLKTLNEQKVFEDLNLFWDKINIENLDVAIFDNNIFAPVSWEIEKIKSSFQAANWKIEALIENKKQFLSKKTQHQEEQNIIEKEITKIQTTLSKIDQNQLPQLKTQKSSFLENEQKLLTSFDLKSIKKYWYEVKNIFELEKLIDKLTSQWRELRPQLDHVNFKIESLNKEKEGLKTNILELELVPWTEIYKQFQKNIDAAKKEIELEIKNIQISINQLEDQKISLSKNVKNIDVQIADIENLIQNQSTFHCQKINSNCPYIKEINVETFNKFETQKNSLIKQKDLLLKEIDSKDFENKIKSLTQKIADLNSKLHQIIEEPTSFLISFVQEVQQKKQQLLKEIDSKDFDKNISTLLEEKKSVEKIINNISIFLKEIDRKKIKDNIVEINNINLSIKEIDAKILKIEEDFKIIDELKNNLNTLLWKKTWIESYINWINDDIKKLENQINIKQNLIQNYNIAQIVELENIIIVIIESFKNINNKIVEFKQNQLNVKKLQEDEKIFNDLYQIFSKELMLVVLQEFLPSLSDIINNLLSSIVDYSIYFEIIKKSSDKIELEINVKDEKWIRNIKSLSWWQKTVLRIVWILAISSMLNVKFLFLDETINNIDQETISKIWELIIEFLKTNDIKFYIVTHSTYIQQMNIWDNVVELNNILN